jgi:hypothetical protein
VSSDIFKTAFKYHTLGRCVIPSGGGDTHKKALIKWEPYKHRQSTEEEVNDWQRQFNPTVWAMITGTVSGLFGLDADCEESAAPLLTAGLKPARRTPRKGYHFDLGLPDFRVKTMVNLFPKVDVRGEGGYVNFTGKTLDGTYKTLQYPTDENLIPFTNLPQEWQDRIREESTKPAHVVSPDEDQEVQPHDNADGLADRILKQYLAVAKVGNRNATGLDLACQLRDNRFTKDDASPIMLRYANAVRDLPSDNGKHSPYTEKEALESLKSAYSRAAREPWTTAEEPPLEEIPPAPHVYSKTLVYRNNVSGQTLNESESDKKATDKATERATTLAARIKAWVEGTAGWWGTDELDKDLSITAPLDRKNRSKTLERLLEQGMVERHQKLNKQWRYVNKKVTRLDYKNALSGGELDIQWPMNIEKYIKVYPGNLVVIAGTTNAGKTAYNLEFIRLNQDKYHIIYICSEMGDVELKSRLELFPNMAIDDWKFEAVTRSTDFADVIVPDVVNIVDYLELAEDLYLVNSYLTKMVERIGSGLVLVSLQKKEGAKWGRGQEFSAEKSKLYLSMDQGVLKITKGKSWTNPKVNPNGLQVGFKIIAGCQFVITKPWDWKH